VGVAFVFWAALVSAAIDGFATLWPSDAWVELTPYLLIWNYLVLQN